MDKFIIEYLGCVVLCTMFSAMFNCSVLCNDYVMCDMTTDIRNV